MRLISGSVLTMWNTLNQRRGGFLLLFVCLFVFWVFFVCFLKTALFPIMVGLVEDLLISA